MSHKQTCDCHSHEEEHCHCESHHHKEEHCHCDAHHHHEEEHCHCDAHHSGEEIHVPSCDCGHEHCHEERNEKITVIRIILSAVLLLVAMFVPIKSNFAVVLFLIPYIIIGYDVLKEALEGILKGQVFDENFLMAVATVGAFILGEYAEGVFVLIFYQTGELFQRYAVGKSKKSIEKLMEIRPDTAFVETDGVLTEIPCEEIEVGTIVTVSPGERIPLDAVVVEGSSTLDLSALTGESMPCDIKVGDEVFSSSVNLSGVLRIRTTKPFSQSTASKIIELMEKASEKKAKSEKFITRFSKIYTPLVCISALLLSVLPPLLSLLVNGSADFRQWIMRGLTFLVISCPCALVMSVPLSFFGGIGRAGKEGILIKNSECLEKIKKIKTVVLDKTGTLTKGQFTVTKIIPYGTDEDTLLKLAAYCEAHSNHPLALGIKNAYGKEIDLSEISEYKETAGTGVSAFVFSKKLAAGNFRLLEKLNIDFDKSEAKETVVYVCEDGKCIGRIHLSDVLKETSKEAVKYFKRNGIKTVMLTGDNKETAEKTAKEADIDEVYAELLPEEKLNILEKIIEEKENGSCVAFVGDGINDAPSIARSDVGIAMGSLGSDAAIEGADLVLMDDNLNKLPLSFKISQKTVRIVKQNIGFSLFVKALCLLLGAFGIANMWLSIFADVGVMMLAVLNALRTMKTK